ncbi:predicted protein [Arabidopsis lyrata subsp. lyrata]|uniref:Predicted protein n=1 Tax=Arabidopsis lyrata subsp. lyrata TaxID=81972 RepID=D7M2T7_ARALL|nr:predicted protein [Arabidopsis lyrata subsp. lyrata]
MRSRSGVLRDLSNVKPSSPMTFLRFSIPPQNLNRVKLFVGLPLDTVSDCNNVDSGRLIGSEIHGFHILQARTLSWGCLLSGFLVMLQSRKFVNKGEILVHNCTRFTGLPNDISFTF